jgi:hypothetical protein
MADLAHLNRGQKHRSELGEYLVLQERCGATMKRIGNCPEVVLADLVWERETKTNDRSAHILV